MNVVKVSILIETSTPEDFEYAMQIENDIRALLEAARLKVKALRVESGE